MADTGWKCKKCGNMNPASENTCNCGTPRPSIIGSPIFYATIGGAAFLLVAILFIIYLVGMPERNYKKTVEANIDKATWQISKEGKQKLFDLRKEYEINNDKAKAWEEEVIAKYKPPVAKKPEPAPVAAKPKPVPPPAPPAEDRASAMKLKKLSAELNFQQGMNYIQNEDYGNAIKEFTAAIDKYPDYAIAYSNRAVAYMQQKKFNLADDDLNKAVQLSPKDANIYYNFTALYSLQTKLDLALIALDKALELGFNKYDFLRKDPDLKNLRKHPEYRQVLEKHKVFLK
jgi:tetratricopeptide (TPR) repeat protein